MGKTEFCPWEEGSPSEVAWTRLHRTAGEYEDSVKKCIEELEAMPEGEAKVWARNSIAGSLHSMIDKVNGGLTHLKKKLGPLCWLCGGIDPEETIKVNCESPGGEECKEKEVKVHLGCYMDIEP